MFTHMLIFYVQGYIQRPDGLPGGHPNCDNYFIYEGERCIPSSDLIDLIHALDRFSPTLDAKLSPLVYIEIPVDDLPTVHFDHPDIHEAYLNGEGLPRGHPSVSGLVRRHLILKTK